MISIPIQKKTNLRFDGIRCKSSCIMTRNQFIFVHPLSYPLKIPILRWCCIRSALRISGIVCPGRLRLKHCVDLQNALFLPLSGLDSILGFCWKHEMGIFPWNIIQKFLNGLDCWVAYQSNGGCVFWGGRSVHMSSKLYSKILTKSPIASFTEIGLRGANWWKSPALDLVGGGNLAPVGSVQRYAPAGNAYIGTGNWGNGTPRLAPQKITRFRDWGTPYCAAWRSL